MKSFNDLANPHLVHAKPPVKRRRAPTYNPNPPKLRKRNNEICTVYPLKVHLYPELIYTNIRPDYENIYAYYTRIIRSAAELKNELLNLL